MPSTVQAHDKSAGPTLPEWLRQWLKSGSYAYFRAKASRHRRNVVANTKIAVVIGSYGKSTTTAACLTAMGRPQHPLFHLNSTTSVAKAVLRVPHGARYDVIEVGINGPGQMAQYPAMLRPDAVIVTSIGSEHGRSFGTLEETRREKAQMLDGLPARAVAILNGDDENVMWMAGRTTAAVISYGLQESNYVHASAVSMEWPYGTRFRLHIGDEQRDAEVKLLGRTQLYPVLAAAALANYHGMPLDDVVANIRNIEPVPGRLQPVALPSGAYLLRDEFKSGLETVDRALDLLAEIPARRRLVVMGEISEPPGSQGPIYGHVGGRIGEIADKVAFVGGNFKRFGPSTHKAGLSRDAIFNARHDLDSAVAFIAQDLGPGDVILVKGRDTQRLDRVSLALAGQTVGCKITRCELRSPRCGECPKLQHG